PEVLFVVATKRHSRRFYRLDGKNLDPGSVMSEGVARNFANEFYMQSAYPLQGTGKTTDYEVLVNSKKFSHEEIVNFSFALCFSHQIVSSATSQPTPVMVAHESAKRGYNNAKTYAQCYGLPMENGEIDLNRLNRELSYVTSSLGYIRFNA
uniref:Piwi domain-containing protein n=1 Tax=Panagrolaimus sp. JU765 TaxID=591449 RepID=A0AC34R8F6_9BILA